MVSSSVFRPFMLAIFVAMVCCPTQSGAQTSPFGKKKPVIKKLPTKAAVERQEAANASKTATSNKAPTTRLPQIKPPIKGAPEFLTTRGPKALIKQGRRVLEIATGREVMKINPLQKGFAVGSNQCTAGNPGVVACAHTESRATQKEITVSKATTEKGKKVTKQVKKKLTLSKKSLVFAARGQRGQLLAKGQDIVVGEKVGRYALRLYGVYVSTRNQPFVFFNETIPSRATKTEGKGDKKKTVTYIKYTTQTYLWSGGGKRLFKFKNGNPARRVTGPNRLNPTLQFVEHGGRVCMAYVASKRDGAINFECLGGASSKVAPDAMYDFRVLSGRDGWMYLFYHSHKNEGANVAVSRDGRSWRRILIDTEESGWQLDAAAYNNDVYAVFYYYRNSFNKGLKLAHLRGGKLVPNSPVAVVREFDYNTGWHPHFTITGNGTTWLTYWDNVMDETRVWSRFASPKHFNRYYLSEKDMGWERMYKPWFLQAGAGGWYTMWRLFDIVPPAKDVDGLELGDTVYSLGNTVLTTVAFEAKLFGFSVGMSYAQSVVEEAAEKLEESAGTDDVGLLSGQIKIDDIFPGADVKLQLTWGRYSGSAVPGEGINSTELFNTYGVNVLPIKTDYIDAQMLFLDKWRQKYGLVYTSYQLPMALHTWSAPVGIEEYDYTGSYFRDVKVDALRLIYGFSSLDYVAKYENRFSSLFVDTSLEVGASYMRFDPIAPSYNSLATGETYSWGDNDSGEPETVDQTFTIDARFNLMVGYLFFKRWYSSMGMGIYVRPAYVVEVSYSGLPFKPSRELDGIDDLEEGENCADNEDCAKENPRDNWIQPGFVSLRHGPWMDIGIVW